MNNYQAKILLTINLRGRLVTPIARKKKLTVFSKNGKEVNKWSQAPHEDGELNTCVRHTVLSEDTYNYFTSNVKPDFYRNQRGPWERLPIKVKLEIHFERMSEGLGFDYEIIE